MPITSNRGYYAGGITLHAGGGRARPAADRHARRRSPSSARCRWPSRSGVEPFFAIVTALPGFSTAHNGRLVIFLLLALALLAGWGLDELVAP